MKATQLVFVLVVGVFMATSCSEKPANQEYLNRLDSLQIALEEVATLYESLDTNQLREQYSVTKGNLRKLESIGNIDDSISVNEYNYVGKSYKMFFKEKPFITEELALTRSQIEHLKNDVSKGLIEKDKTELYFEQERQAVRVLKHKMSFYYQRISSYQKQFEELNPKIEMIVDSLSQN